MSIVLLILILLLIIFLILIFILILIFSSPFLRGIENSSPTPGHSAPGS
jgi:hypothetical protein